MALTGGERLPTFSRRKAPAVAYRRAHKRARRAPRRKSTAADKKAVKIRNAARRAILTTGIQEARELIHAKAVALHETDGQHSVDWIERQIYHCAPKKRREEKESPDKWQTFIAGRMKEINEGVYFTSFEFPVGLSLTLHIIPR